MKNRKQLPPYGYLDNLRIDIEALRSHLQAAGLLDWGNYDHIQLDRATTFRGFVVANEYLLNNMFKGEEEREGNSDLFRQIQLTEFDQSLSHGPVESKPTTFMERVRRQNPRHPSYVPEAAELNYGKRNELVCGEIERIFDLFTSRITRGRLAFMAPGHEIKAHVDYDTTLVCRYHIPVVTNPGVLFYVQRGKTAHEYHMPADGRVYFFNQGLKHWVKNNGDTPRLHLIIDVHGQTEIEHLVPIEGRTLPLETTKSADVGAA